MSLFDPFTVSAMTMLVVCVSGTVFILETMLRRDERASRLWALGFVAVMLSSIASLVATGTAEAIWVLAAANAAIVAATGCMWLGCRRYNERPMLIPLIVVMAVTVIVGVVSFVSALQSPVPGMIAVASGLVALATAGAVESASGVMGRVRTAWGLAFVFGAQALFSAARVVAYFTVGPTSDVFQTWFGQTFTSFITVALVIVAVVVASVLRARRAPLRGYGPSLDGGPASGDEIEDEATFRRRLIAIVDRARVRRELVALIAVRLEDLDQISTAFGSDVARSVVEAWRAGVRGATSPLAVIGADGLTGLFAAVIATSPTDARRQAAHVYRALFDGLGGVAGGVIPVIGVGVALSAAEGYDADELMRVARDAARRAALSVESSVLVGEGHRGGDEPRITGR